MAAEEGLQRDVEELHIDLAHVIAHPLLEDVDEESTVLFGTYRALSHQVASRRPAASRFAGFSGVVSRQCPK